MGSFRAIAAVGNSLVRLIEAGFAAQTPIEPSPPGVGVSLVRTEDFDQSAGSHSFVFPHLSVFLYRVEPNRTMRAAWAGVSAHDGRVHTVVDLHYLLTAWAANADHEHRILGRTMQWLDTHPVLVGPLLDPMADAAPGEAVQLVPDDVPSETIFRVFDLLPCKYRVSLPYVARVVRLDGPDPRVDPPVLDAATGARPSVGGAR